MILHSDDDFDIILKPALKESGKDRHHRSLAERVAVHIHSKEPRPLSEVQKVVHACKDFLSVACLSYCDIEDLTVDLAPRSDGRTTRATYHAVPIYKPSDRHRSASSDFLFRFADIEARAADAFRRWFAVAEVMSPVRSLYLSGVYGGGFLEVKLVALAQAAEAYHRRFYPGVYLDRGQFEVDVLRRLVDAIPPELDPAFRDALRQRLRYADEYSLRKRLRTLIAEHEGSLGKVVENPRNYVDLIVDHRNTFAHQPAETNDPRSRDRSEELLRCIYVLRLLLELCFLKTAGFSPDEMESLVLKNETYRQIRHRFFNAGPSPAAGKDARSGSK